MKNVFALRHKRNRRRAPGRALSLLLCLPFLLALLPILASAAGTYTVDFLNYDLSSLTGNYNFSNVPEGARLYTAEDMITEIGSFRPTEGCGWYLYHPAGEDGTAYGPYPIADPPAREGYTFQDWAAQGATDSALHTVTV